MIRPNHSLEDQFPQFRASEHAVTSPHSVRYNCIAWAFGRDDVWAWPDALEQCYWPPLAPRAETIDAFVAAFGALGYQLCESEAIEASVDKVAIYTLHGRPTHAARQLPCGRWTSKLGSREDIAHSLNSIEGDTYGTIAVLLSRPQPTAVSGPSVR